MKKKAILGMIVWFQLVTHSALAGCWDLEGQFDCSNIIRKMTLDIKRVHLSVQGATYEVTRLIQVSHGLPIFQRKTILLPVNGGSPMEDVAQCFNDELFFKDKWLDETGGKEAPNFIGLAFQASTNTLGYRTIPVEGEPFVIQCRAIEPLKSRGTSLEELESFLLGPEETSKRPFTIGDLEQSAGLAKRARLTVEGEIVPQVLEDPLQAPGEPDRTQARGWKNVRLLPGQRTTYEFGQFLRDLRMEKGLLQTDLGPLVGLSFESIHNIETGDSFPSPSKAVELARVLGVTPEQLWFKPDAPDVYGGAYFKKMRVLNGYSARDLLHEVAKHGHFFPATLISSIEVQNRAIKMEEVSAFYPFLGGDLERYFDLSSPGANQGPSLASHPDLLPGQKTLVEFGQDLSDLMAKKGMKLRDLIKQSGMTHSFLRQVQRGLKLPSAESGLKIALALGVTMEELYFKPNAPVIRGGDYLKKMRILAGMDQKGLLEQVSRDPKFPKYPTLICHLEIGHRKITPELAELFQAILGGEKQNYLEKAGPQIQ